MTLLFMVAGCGTADEAVNEARSQAEDIAREAGQVAQLAQFCTAALDLGRAVQNRDRQAALDAAETAAAEAPEEIAEEAQRALEGAERLAEGDESVLENQEFRDAVEAVGTYARNNCDPTS